MTINKLTNELIYSLADGIATLTFNRPDKLNACTTTMYAGIEQVAEEVRNNDKAKVLILTGSGKGFCAGSDAKDRLQTRLKGEKLEKTRKDMTRPVGDFGTPLYNLGKPIIGAINGVCVGGGLSFALICDIRIASDQAKFGAVWVRRGLVPDIGATYLLPRTVGLGNALKMCFTGDILDADEAKNIGLVTEIVPHEDLMNKAHELAKKISNGPSVAIEIMKRGMYRAMGGDYAAQLDFESYAQNLCFKTEDFEEGTAAFLEKRKPNYKGM